MKSHEKVEIAAGCLMPALVLLMGLVGWGVGIALLVAIVVWVLRYLGVDIAT